MPTTTTTARVAALLCASALLTTAGCANSERAGQTRNAGPSSASAPAQPHNDADIAFAQQMIPRHTQALEMAAMVADHNSGDQVRDLVGRIQPAVQPEIDTMIGWLKAWGVPAASHGVATMDPQQTQRLRAATGPDFDRLWLALMVEQHRGALALARAELTAGGSSDAKALANQILSGQQLELDEMTSLLN